MITETIPPHFQGDDWFKIVPSDVHNFVGDTLNNPKGYDKAAVYVGAVGDINCVSEYGANEVFKNVPSGQFLPLSVVRINASGTSAYNLIGVVGLTKIKVQQ